MNSDSSQTRNLLLFFGLSLLILFGYQWFFPKSSSVTTVSETRIGGGALPLPLGGVLPHGSTVPIPTPKREIDTPTLFGTINNYGLRFDALFLKNYRQTVASDSEEVELLRGGEAPYFAEFGLLGGEGKVPDLHTPWTVEGEKLTPDSPLLYKWVSPEGVVFERLITIDDQYMLSVTQRVMNRGSMPVVFSPYAKLVRKDSVHEGALTSSALFEGPMGILGGKLEEISYGDLDKKPQSFQGQGGWAGFSDKYWLGAIIPDSKAVGRFDLQHQAAYEILYTGTPQTVLPSEEWTETQHLYGGAKIVSVLDAYEKTLGIDKLDRAVDFGMFYLITKPLFYLLTFIYENVRSMAISILLLTVVVKGALFPLANKSYRSMAKMRTLAPKVEALKEKYGEDKVALNREMMALYKKEKVNPGAGCLPILLQFPILFGLYKVLMISIEMRQAPFWGWIHDMSAPDPTNLFTLFGVLSWDPPSFLCLGLWPLIMGATMVLQQKMGPTPADPTQAQVMMIMPIIFTFMMAQFPSGLVIYWTWSNLLGILQQWWITRSVVSS